MWSPANTMKYSALAARKISKFWYTASAVPRYQVASSSRCWAGNRSRNSFISGRRKDQPICRWRNRLCALYWVRTQIRRTPELRQFDSAKSMMRNLPPKNTAGLARRSVNCFSRLPRPPSSTRASARRVSLCWGGPLDSISAPPSVGDARTVRHATTRVNHRAAPSVGCLAERLQLCLENRLFALEAMKLDQEPLAIRIRGARDLLAQARQVALNDLQIGIDRAPIERVGRDRLVGEHGAALRRHFCDTADDKNPPCDGLALVNLDHPRPDRRDQRRVTREHAEIPFGAGHHHHLDHFREQQTLGRDQLELQTVGHRLRSDLRPLLPPSSAPWRGLLRSCLPYKRRFPAGRRNPRRRCL